METTIGCSTILETAITQIIESCGGNIIERTVISDESWITVEFPLEIMRDLFNERMSILLDVFVSNSKLMVAA